MTDLPPGWEWATLADTCQIVSGSTPKTGNPEYWGGSIPWITPDDLAKNSAQVTMNGCRSLTEAGYQSCSTTLVPPGSVLYSSRAPIGYVTIAGQSVCTNQGFKNLTPSSGINSRYLYWYLIHQTPEIRKRASGTTFKEISAKEFGRTLFPIAPLAEQRRIVIGLENHLSRLDAAARYLASAHGRLPALVGAMINAEIGDPSDNNYGQLADVLDRIEAGKSFGSSARPAAEGEWGIIKVSAMTWGEFRPSENKFVPDGERVDPRYEIKPGDILVSRANTEQYVGAPVLVRSTRRKLLLSDKSLRLVPKSDVDRNWLIEVLASPQVRKQISKKATGTKDSMRNISQASLKEVRIPLHEADRQRDVAAVLAERREAAQRLDSELTAAAELRSRLRHSLLADAFAGRLVPQDPDDEPASVLLERIRAEHAAKSKPKRTRRITQNKITQEALP